MRFRGDGHSLVCLGNIALCSIRVKRAQNAFHGPSAMLNIETFDLFRASGIRRAQLSFRTELLFR